jgi:hypothetical protein
MQMTANTTKKLTVLIDLRRMGVREVAQVREGKWVLVFLSGMQRMKVPWG